MPNELSQDELKPCPFCGGEVIVLDVAPKHMIHSDITQCFLGEMCFDIKEWNTRTQCHNPEEIENE